MSQTPIQLCCPICREQLRRDGGDHHCGKCHRLYPSVFGIPDFRVSLPPHFNRVRDMEIARTLSEASPESSFEDLLRLYLRLLPPRPDALREQHQLHFKSEGELACMAMDLIEERRAFAPGDALLDVGCGRGEYMETAAGRVDHVTGVDLSLTVLVLARKRLGDRGLVLAAEAERLPFPDAAFAAVIAADVIEHFADPPRVVEEVGRVLQPGTPAFFSTPNRFSLTAEPHVGLWGVGLIPRKWALSYVRRRRGVSYEGIRLFSAASLRRLLRKHFPGRAIVLIPGLSLWRVERFPLLKRLAARLYLILRRVSVLRSVFYVCGPFFQVVAQKRC
jgi:SAM-dependent methyltransferase